MSIGNFDGLHLGHRHIFKKCIEKARQIGADKVVAVTFEPHPVYLLRPEKAPKIITPFDIKAKLLENAGVDELAVITDSLKLLNMSPEAFVKDFLKAKFSPSAVIEGCNFQFGYGRSGNIGTLRELGKKYGFTAHCEELEEKNFSTGRQKISSTLIRHFIEQGQVEDASNALGRPYRLAGEVISGRGIGRTLGFPTANIDPFNQVHPGDGVYAGYVQIGDSIEDLATYSKPKLLPSVYSIGRAKTFNDGAPLLTEAHILDPSEEVMKGLYGKWIAMDFVFKIRNQQAFENRDALKAQIAKDCITAKNILNENGLGAYSI